MSYRIPRPVLLCSAAMALALATGCVSTTSDAGTVQFRVQGQFEKLTFNNAGQVTSTQVLPARYCYAEVRRSSDEALLDSAILDASGQATCYVDGEENVFVALYPAWELPASSGTDFFMRGSVIYDNGQQQIQPPFDFTDAWYVTSDIRNSSSGGLTLTAQASTREAGAFNIADQSIRLFTAVRDLLPSSARMPNLHTYWSTNLDAAGQPGLRRYPAAALDNASHPLRTASGRAIFTNALNGQAGVQALVETDEWDDGTIREACAHLLFANYSAASDGHLGYSFLRRDCDLVRPTRLDSTRQLEPSLAFVQGFSSFLAAAAVNDPVLKDSYRDASTAFRTATLDLSARGDLSGQTSEYGEAAIAKNLWAQWKLALGGSSAGLQALWSAVQDPTRLNDDTGAYLSASLGAYPTYLKGLSALQPGSWASIQAQLGAEAIPDPTLNGYFTDDTRLWTAFIGQTGTVNGSVQLRAEGGRIQDRDQASIWRYDNGGGAGTVSRTFTLTVPSGRKLFLEVLGPGGWLGGASNTGTTATLTLTLERDAWFALRVRADESGIETSCPFSLQVQ